MITFIIFKLIEEFSTPGNMTFTLVLLLFAITGFGAWNVWMTISWLMSGYFLRKPEERGKGLFTKKPYSIGYMYDHTRCNIITCLILTSIMAVILDVYTIITCMFDLIWVLTHVGRGGKDGTNH